MRFLLFSVSLVICLSLTGQDYKPLVIEGNSWAIVNWSWGWAWTDYLFLDGDTIINDTAYTKVYFSTDSTLQNDVSYLGGIREDTINKEIFFNHNSLMEEFLLYRFGMNIGDSALVSSMACYPIYMIVADVDTITDELGIDRRRMLLDHWYDWYDEYWIEGIGSTLGLLTAGNFSCIADYNQELLCFSRNGLLNYMNPLYNRCFITEVTIDEQNTGDKQVQIIPNPVSGTSVIKISGDVQIKNCKVFDSYGRVVYEPSVANPKIEKGSLKPGIYFLKIEVEGREVYKCRFLVQ